jgi:MscS family membrane protein
VLSEIRRVLESHPKIEASTLRVRLIEIAAALNVEIFSYVLTRDFNEFAAVREELLLQIMDLVEEAGTSVALPSQTLYIHRDFGVEEEKMANAGKKLSDLRAQQSAAQSKSPKPDAAS